MPQIDLFVRFMKRTVTLLIAVGLAANYAAAADAYTPFTVRIGYQKYGTLVLLKARGDLDRRLAEKGVKVTWSEFPGGVRLLEALNLGSIDFGTTGDAPPIFAQAAGAPLLYVGYEPPTPKGIAFLVKKDSSIHSIKDLKGKKVSVNKGGNVHYLLLRALEENGLKPSDIEVVYLPPSDARPAYERGAIDAWVIWDPFLAHAQHTTDSRVIQDGTGLSQNYQFYFASKPLAQQRPEFIEIILEEIRKVDEFAKANVTRVAEQLAPEIGMDKTIIEAALGRMGYGVQPLNASVITSQQKVAETFYKAGIVPKLVKIDEAIWRPASTK